MKYSWTMQALYGFDPSKTPSRDAAFSNPDFDAGAKGDTVGGLGNTTGMGEDITWGAPVTKTATYGGSADTIAAFADQNTLKTHQGDYRARWNPETQTWYLQTVPGTGGVNLIDEENRFYNLSRGDLHVGINPYTGEMWYQKAEKIPTGSGFSSGMMQPSRGGTGTGTSSASEQKSAPSTPSGSTTKTETAPSDSTTGVADQVDTGAALQQTIPSSSGGGAFSAMAPASLSYQAAQVPAMPSASPKVDYVKLLNGMLAANVVGGMMTGRKV